MVNSLSTWKFSQLPFLFQKLWTHECLHLFHLFLPFLHACSNPLTLGSHDIVQEPGWLAEATQMQKFKKSRKAWEFVYMFENCYHYMYIWYISVLKTLSFGLHLLVQWGIFISVLGDWSFYGHRQAPPRAENILYNTLIRQYQCVINYCRLPLTFMQQVTESWVGPGK